MDSLKEARLKACLAELSELLYEETAAEDIATLEGIESRVRQHLLETVGPKLGSFLSKKRLEQLGEESESSKAVLGS